MCSFYFALLVEWSGVNEQISTNSPNFSLADGERERKYVFSYTTQMKRKASYSAPSDSVESNFLMKIPLNK